MKRKVVNIDEDKCTGCGLCIPNCAEGALQIIDGKARLISDLFCDGLGACLGHCPEDAITLEEREAEPYDERKVMANMVGQGPNVIKAHMKHLKEHGEMEYLRQAAEWLRENGVENPMLAEMNAKAGAAAHGGGGCPGSRAMTFAAAPKDTESDAGEDGQRPSRLTHWPVQLHLASPRATQYQSADVLLSADCVGYALGDFHKDWLKGKALLIACPKLDTGQEVYVEKIRALIDDAKINTLTVMIMEVPCCSGLLALAKRAAQAAQRKVPIKCAVVGVQGGVISEEWV